MNITLIEKVFRICKWKYLFTFTAIIMIIFTFLFISWIIYILSIPTRQDYFYDSFKSGISSWKTLDSAWKYEYKDKVGVVELSKKKYAAPYLMHELNLKKLTSSSFVWHFNVYVSSFTGESVTLGALRFPTSQLVVVTDKKGNLGVSSSIFDKPIYNTNMLESLEKNKWQDIYVQFISKSETIKLYKNNTVVLTTEFKPNTYPVQEVWLGSFWLEGAGKYGAPINISYDEINLSNEGALPKVSFIEYVLNFFKKMFGRVLIT